MWISISYRLILVREGSTSTRSVTSHEAALPHAQWPGRRRESLYSKLLNLFQLHSYFPLSLSPPLPLVFRTAHKLLRRCTSVFSLGWPWEVIRLLVYKLEFVNVPECSPKGRKLNTLNAIAHSSQSQWVDQVNKRQVFLCYLLCFSINSFALGFV